MKLSGYQKTIGNLKTYIADFLFRLPKARPILQFPHYKAMGEKTRPFHTHQVRLFYMDWVILGYC